ncbi:MAG: hypothetical protein HYU51_00770 [Candidatus Rokubacteria bacterium]|nr:hypothetical protein [Candidatus Rokubacteria bacterium]
MNGRGDMSDEALARRLASELPRHQAPAHVRAAVVRLTRGRQARWLAPALSALATAAVLVLGVLPRLPVTPRPDAVQQLVNAVVAEHTRALMWGARTAEMMPAGLPRVTRESGIRLDKAFLGDDRLEFLGAEPVYLDWRRGVALHYLDRDGHRVTYVALRAPPLPMPERQRVQVNRFRPALVKLEGFGSWVWNQGDVTCFIVSDIVSEHELARFKDYFVRIRGGTEPKLVY